MIRLTGIDSPSTDYQLIENLGPHNLYATSEYSRVGIRRGSDFVAVTYRSESKGRMSNKKSHN